MILSNLLKQDALSSISKEDREDAMRQIQHELPDAISKAHALKDEINQKEDALIHIEIDAQKAVISGSPSGQELCQKQEDLSTEINELNVRYYDALQHVNSLKSLSDKIQSLN